MSTKKTSILTWIIGAFVMFVVLNALLSKPTQQEINNFPTSEATYKQINKDIGCGSKFTDDKKDDIFETLYKNHWMTWKGKVVIASADKASLNIDNFGTQDLTVDFANVKAGYNLIDGATITVKFVMSTSGGCFLPFGGTNAVILK